MGKQNMLPYSNLTNLKFTLILHLSWPPITKGIGSNQNVKFSIYVRIQNCLSNIEREKKKIRDTGDILMFLFGNFPGVLKEQECEQPK